METDSINIRENMRGNWKRVSSGVNKPRKSLYNPEFVKKIKSQERAPSITVDIKNLWK
jgi:hypothetical protein